MDGAEAGRAMSRGPGALQRRILREIENAPEERLMLGEIRGRLGDADPSNLRRAITSLKRMGELSEYVADGVVWLALPEYDAISGEGLNELLEQINRLSENVVEGVVWHALPECATISDEELDTLLAETNRPLEG